MYQIGFESGRPGFVNGTAVVWYTYYKFIDLQDILVTEYGRAQ